MFFRITGLSNEDEPVGAQGVPLMPGRSIAVDKIHVYGTPFYIEASLPIDSAKPMTPFRRLMIAQDTGSAIVGPARADLYWGAGDDAGRIAGRIRHPGRFVMLLPRELDMVAAGRQMPLPVAKPKIPDDDAKKDRPKKDEVKKRRRQVRRNQERGRQAEAGGRQERRPNQGAEEIARAGRTGPRAAGVMTADDGKPRRRKLTDDERALWDGITRSVAPLRRRRVIAEASGCSRNGGANRKRSRRQARKLQRATRRRRSRSPRRGSSRLIGA